MLVTCANLQVINDPDDFSGDFDAVALVVGANNIGNYSVREVVETIDETLEILQYLNPGACVFASEVRLTFCERSLLYDGWC